MLVFDADDTLWENNIRFDRVVAEYVAWLVTPARCEAAIRTALRAVEEENTIAYGYGSRVFLRTLRDCLERLNGRPASEQERQRIHELGDALARHRVELVPAVDETLRDLGRRHRLALLTKGDHAEQYAKLESSGLSRHFGSVHVVAQKDPAAYRALADRLSVRPEQTWMIGNSPRSDVLPARQAGWSAVFIPNANTWALDDCEIEPDDRVLRLRTFAELLDHF